MTIDLYYILASSPCRAVMMTAKLLGLDLNLKLVDLTKGEQMSPEFLKINPLHTVPVLDDNGFILTESRVILTYLCDKYGKDDTLYPKDLRKRALVQEKLFFDLERIILPGSTYFRQHVLGDSPLDEAKFQQITSNFPVLDEKLKDSKFAAGDSLTIADVSLVASIVNFDVIGIDLSKYANIQRWYAECKKAIPEYEEINQKGAANFKRFWDFSMAKKMGSNVGQ